MTLPSKLAAATLLLLGFQATAACNAVLGIERADLDESAGTNAADCHWPAADPMTDCFADTCESCADTCGIAKCVADRDCRKKLRDYRKCAGDKCDDKANQCSDCLADNAQASRLLSCLGKCNCGPAKAATLCESYCTCMDQKCQDDEPGGALAQCLSACSGATPGVPGPFQNGVLTDWQVYCMWDHCERAASDNDGFHCHHAAGIGSNCSTPPTPNANAPLCEYPRVHPNAACNVGDDCCSGSCDNGRGVCD